MNADISYFGYRFKPICTTPYGLIVYHRGAIYLYDSTEFTQIISIKAGLKTKAMESLRLIERITRGEPKAGIYYNGNVYLALSNSIIAINLDKKQITRTYNYRTRYIHTSRITAIENVPGFESCLAYGEYFDNPRREKVCIYTKRPCSDDFEIAHSFPSGSIKHIHTLIPDITNKCVYILTGDADKESGIWKATSNFTNVEPLLVGNQDYRACIGFTDGEHIVFATDIPSRQNYIVSYSIRTGQLKNIYPISGSCTTGCCAGDLMIFGSTVEAKEPKGTGRISRLQYLLGRKRADGIQDDYARLYVGTVENGFKELVKYKKDVLPAGLCQFGRINVLFSEQTDEVILYAVGLKDVDGHIGKIPAKVLGEA